VLEREAVQKLHGYESVACFLADVVNGADVRMIERGGGPRFAAETLECLCVQSQIFGKKFQGHETGEAGIFGFVDYTHPSSAEFLEDAVMRNGLSEHGAGVWYAGRESKSMTASAL